MGVLDAARGPPHPDRRDGNVSRYPAALWAPAGTPGAPITPRVLIFHTAVAAAHPTPIASTGLEWHFSIGDDGSVVQRVDTNQRADAQWDANPFAISCETTDGGDPEHHPWTPAQLDAMVALARWCNATHGIAFAQAARWDGTGLGYHRLFPEWNHSHHSCPGDLRASQWPAFLARFTQPEDPFMALTDAQQTELHDAAVSANAAARAVLLGNFAGGDLTWLDVRLAALAAEVHGISVPGGTTDIDALASALAAALGPKVAADLAARLAT